MADIQSSRSRPGNKLMREFHELTKYVNEFKRSSILSPLTITLGDEFQGVVKDVKSAIKLIIVLEERIIQEQYDIKLRYVLHVGNIESQLNRKVAYEMLGPGLTRARESLFQLKKEECRFHFFTRRAKQDLQLNNAFLIYQSFVDDWKLEDYKTAIDFIHGKDYKLIAEEMGVYPTTSWRRKRSLKISQYLAIKELILSLD